MTRTRIVARAGELREGLFGGVILFVFEILPFLDERGNRPEWRIASLRYGAEPDHLIIPGLFDPVERLEGESVRTMGLIALRTWRALMLGSDWLALSALWGRFFAVPDRIVARTDAHGDLTGTFGVHYRGHDKQTNASDSNPISHDDFLVIVEQELALRPDIERVFVATDDAEFLEAARRRLTLPVASAAAGAHHLDWKPQEQRLVQADMAVSDCLALSRCAAVLMTSSALPAFAKVLNPRLEIHRCAASKLFADVPYFPVAYIPIVKARTPQVEAILHRTLRDDWVLDEKAAVFRPVFAWRRRSPWRMAGSRLVARARRTGGRVRRLLQTAPKQFRFSGQWPKRAQPTGVASNDVALEKRRGLSPKTGSTDAMRSSDGFVAEPTGRTDETLAVRNNG